MVEAVNSGEREFAFLKGGGEMGARTRSFDWSGTAVGDPETWPQSLRTTVSIILNSRFPMFLWWGEELIQFYNDAYRPSLGNEGKHPTALGQRGEECWPEIWPTIKPLIDQVKAGGGATWSEDQYLPIYRNGRLEDVYWTFGYSPVTDEAGEVCGVLVVCNETTEQVQTLNKLKNSEQRFQNLVRDATVGIIVLTGEELNVDVVNDAYGQLVGRTTEELRGKPLFSVIPDSELHFKPLIDSVKNTGEPLYLYDYPYGAPKMNEGFLNIVYQPYKEQDGTISGVMVLCQNVTEQVRARKKLLESEHRFRDLIEASPIRTILITGKDRIVELANEPVLRGWGKDTSVLGKPLLEILPEMKDQPFPQILSEVFSTGVAYSAEDMPASYMLDGGLQTFYFDLSYLPVKTAEGEVYGILSTAVDVTEKVLAKRQLEEQKAYLQDALDIANLGTFKIDIASNVATYTDNVREWFGLTDLSASMEEIVSKVDPEDIDGALKAIVQSCLSEAANGHDIYYRTVAANGKVRYMRSIGKTAFIQGTAQSINGTIQDVTQELLAQKAIEESERNLRNIILQAPVAMCILDGPKHIVKTANERMFELWGRSGEELMNHAIFEALPEASGQGFEEMLDAVYKNGERISDYSVPISLPRDGHIETVYINFMYEPFREADGTVSGVMAVAVDVTEQVLAGKKVAESEQKLRSVVESAPFPIGVYVGREMRIQLANQTIMDVWGKGNDVVGKLYSEVLPELENQAIYPQLDGVYTTGIPFHAKNQRVDLVVDGKLQPYYFNYSFTPLRDTGGKVYGVMNTAAEVTDLVVAKQQVEQAEEALLGAIELAELGTWELDAATGILSYSERIRAWFGLKDHHEPVANVYNPIYEKDRARVIAAIDKALQGEAGGTYDEEYTLIEEHTGRERIVHAQGKTFFDEKGKPVRMTGTAQDVTQQRRLQQELERQVNERTTELATKAIELAEANQRLTHSNEELAQYAYVASHDLQEPLRKIRIFSGMLQSQGELSQRSRELVSKMDSSSQRMALLIKDLLDFSRLLQTEQLVQSVDLAEICNAVVSDFELSIQEKNAEIRIGQLPVIEGVGLQMNQLFYNLMSNAFKFSREGVRPEIEINSKRISASEAAGYVGKTVPEAVYYDITFSDNGIGFEAKYADQIFEVFKRLHGREIYPGSGIGLALCRRIVANQHGHLYAESTPGVGSTFHIILPDRQMEGVHVGEHSGAVVGNGWG